MKYDVNKMTLNTICQKCPAKPTKTPLTEFLLPNGLLWVPDLLFCPECGNYVTIQVRELTKEELKERDKKTAEAIIEVTGEVVKDAILNDPLNDPLNDRCLPSHTIVDQANKDPEKVDDSTT